MDKVKAATVFLVVGSVIAAGFGLVAYRSARAAQEPPDIWPKNMEVVHVEAGLFPGRGVSDEELAAALGITLDELNAAYENARSAALDQALEQGLITEAQADQLRERGFAFPFGGHWEGWLSQNGIDYQALLSDALGVSTADLQAGYIKAYNTRIDQAEESGFLSQEEADLMKGQYALQNSQSFRTAMRSAFEAAVRQAVTDGVVTQAQADRILENLSDNGGFLPGFHGPGIFKNGRRPGGLLDGFRMPGLRMPGFQAPPVPSATPSSSSGA